MRPTLQTINRNTLLNLNRLATELHTVNQQIASGRKMDRPSDDPVNMVGILGLRTNLGEIRQYQENLDYGDNTVRASEEALTQVKELATRARTLGLQQINATVSADDRASAAREIRNLLEQGVILGNTQINGKYIFGGHRTTGYTDAEPAPFMVDRISGYRINGINPAAIDLAAPTPAPVLAAGDLLVNGLAVGASLADGLSDIYDDASATAKETAINAIADDTGVRAVAVPVNRMAGAGVEAGTMDSGDLVINGVDIFAGPTAVVAADVDNVLLTAINAQQAVTGVVATRNSDGQLLLAAVDGRNLHIETSANGEQLTHLNDDTLAFPATAQDKVYFGSVQLLADNRFFLETPLAAEAGLDAIGLAGGQAVTGEVGDVAGDGLIVVDDVVESDSLVRYTGDPDHDLDIRVGRSSTLTVGRNGQDVLMDTGTFTAMKALEDALLSQNYTATTGFNRAIDTSVTLATGGTGLRQEDDIVSGTFTVQVTDRGYSPPRDLTLTIGVDPAQDSLDSIAAKLQGIPGLEAAWNPEGYLEVQSSDPERYSFQFSEDSSNLLVAVGIREEDMQVQAIESAIADLEDLFANITNEISDFGARANRIDSQREIFQGLELAGTENLSGREDTDMVKALLELKTKEVAYEAALNAAAKTMKLSLVNFL